MHDLDEIHVQQVTSVDFSRCGSYVVTNSRDNTVKLIDVRTWKILKEFEGTTKEPYRNAVNWNRATFSPDSQYIVAGGQNGHLYIWNVDSGKVVNILNPTPPLDLGYNPNTALIQANADKGYAIPTSLSASNSPASTPSSAHRERSESTNLIETAISCVDWNRNGRQIISCDNGGNIYFWE